MFCFYWSLLKQQKVLLRDEGQPVKPEVAQDGADMREEQPRAAGSPGSGGVEVLPLRHGQCGTPLCPHQAPLKSSLSSMTERSEDDAEWSENDDYSRAFVSLGSQRKALPLQLASGEGFCLQKAGEPKPWLGNMPAPLHPGLTS